MLKPTDPGASNGHKANREKAMTTNGEILCDHCKTRVEAPVRVSYKGKDFHRDCFLLETETPNLKKNPPIKMVMQPRDVKVVLDVMEAYIADGDSSSAIDAESDAESESENEDPPPTTKLVKRLYANIAIRLSEAGKGFGTCTHCGRARYYETMIAGGASKKKVLASIEALELLVRKKAVDEIRDRELARIRLFCDDSCDTLFAARPLNEQLENFAEIKELLLKNKKVTLTPLSATSGGNSAKKDTKELIERCVECNENHATFECEECGDPIGYGKCFREHQLQHVEEQVKEEEALMLDRLSELGVDDDSKNATFADHEAMIKEHLRDYDIIKLRNMVKSAKQFKLGMSLDFGKVKITAFEWQRLLAEVMESKRVGGLG